MNDDQASSEFMKLNKIIIQLFKKKKSIRKKIHVSIPTCLIKKKCIPAKIGKMGVNCMTLKTLEKSNFVE